jgi:hypothetical protein
VAHRRAPDHRAGRDLGSARIAFTLRNAFTSFASGVPSIAFTASLKVTYGSLDAKDREQLRTGFKAEAPSDGIIFGQPDGC